jgi:hypothetical protein
MVGVCAGYFRPKFLLREMIILRESNSHARRQVYIPHMGSKLQTSHTDDLRQTPEVAKGQKTQTQNIRQSIGLKQANKMIARDALAVFRHRPAWATTADHCPCAGARCRSHLGTEENKGNEEFKNRKDFVARIVGPEAQSDCDSLEPRTEGKRTTQQSR